MNKKTDNSRGLFTFGDKHLQRSNTGLIIVFTGKDNAPVNQQVYSGQCHASKWLNY